MRRVMDNLVDSVHEIRATCTPRELASFDQLQAELGQDMNDNGVQPC